jgi:alpha-beta hydrolase superfamily lysophospholipase
MRSSETTFHAGDGQRLFVRHWEPDDAVPRRGVAHVVHGMAEHSGRYGRLADALTARGFVVHAHDHRGHGQTAEAAEDLGHFGDGVGWGRVVDDVLELLRAERAEHAGVPLLLVGHSMGSFMVQQVLYTEPALVDLAVLSGTDGKPDLLAAAGRGVARIERLRLGRRGKSALLQSLTFDAWNKAFAPNRTAFDWLSRDPAEVDKYVDDPRCGFPCTTDLWVELLDALGEIARPESQARIRKDLPVYVFCGAEDPVGRRTKGVEQLLAAYRRAGLTDVTHRFYPGARHETLNEENRGEVTADLLEWLDLRMSARASRT